MQSQFAMAELTLLGVLEVLPKAAHVLRRVREVAAAILDQRPDVVVTVDAPAFSFRVGKKIKGQGIRHIHYVAPQSGPGGRVGPRWWPVSSATSWRFSLSSRLFRETWPGHQFRRPFGGGRGGRCRQPEGRGRGAAGPARHRGRRPVLVVLPGSRSSEVKRLGPASARLWACWHSAFRIWLCWCRRCPMSPAW